MKNPLIKTSYHIQRYVFLWAILIIAHSYLVYSHSNLKWYWTILDSLLFNLSFSIFILPYYYAVKFSQLEKSYFLLQLFTIGSILLTMWLSIFYLIIWSLRLPTNVEYFMLQTVDFRLIIGFIYVSFFTLLYMILNYSSHIEQKNEHVQVLQNTEKEQQLIVLKSQLQPHFLFNTLNAIHGLLEIDNNKAREMLLNLSVYLRKTLDKSEKGLIPLKEELEHIHTYLNIEKIRFGTRLQINWNIQDNCNKCLLPDMLLQPIFENTIKHGLSNTIGEFVIKCNFEFKENFLHISINNPTESEIVNPDGVGLQNLKKRMFLYYGKRDLIVINTTNHKYCIQLKIPQNETNLYNN